jgi:hypothetical protein
MLIIRIYKNWRICQKWHYDERYKEYVTLNCKNPVAAIDRVKKQMIIDQRKREALSAALDLTDSLPKLEELSVRFKALSMLQKKKKRRRKMKRIIQQ